MQIIRYVIFWSLSPPHTPPAKPFSKTRRTRRENQGCRCFGFPAFQGSNASWLFQLKAGQFAVEWF